MNSRNGSLRGLSRAYLLAKQHVIECGFEREIIWQEQRNFKCITEREFLREVVWVILSSGMREGVIRKLFPSICNALGSLVSANAMLKRAAKRRKNVLSLFDNPRKINAIFKIASLVSQRGFDKIYQEIAEHGLKYLRSLPYMGPATSQHLAKNLGLSVAKPDRHLQRIARASGFDSANELCAALAEELDEPIAVVDIVLWRYATLAHNYESEFSATV